MTAAVVIGWLHLSDRESVRIALDVYRGADRVDVRVCAPIGPAGGRFPTGKGLSIPVELLPDFAAALATAEVEARRLGLLFERAAAA